MTNTVNVARGRPSAHRRRASGPDVEQVARAVVCRAAEDVDLACRFLETLGLIPSEKKRLKNPIPLPLGLLLKVAAYARLLRWEGAGLIGDLPELPAADEVLDDLSTATPSPDRNRLDGKMLARDVLGAWFRRMSWNSPAPAADVVLRGHDPEAVLDELAQILWSFRNLSTLEN